MNRLLEFVRRSFWHYCDCLLACGVIGPAITATGQKNGEQSERRQNRKGKLLAVHSRNRIQSWQASFVANSTNVLTPSP